MSAWQSAHRAALRSALRGQVQASRRRARHGCRLLSAGNDTVRFPNWARHSNTGGNSVNRPSANTGLKIFMRSVSRLCSTTCLNWDPALHDNQDVLFFSMFSCVVVLVAVPTFVPLIFNILLTIVADSSNIYLSQDGKT